MSKKTTSALILLAPLATGVIAAFITRGGIGIYDRFVKPPLSPPSWVFPAVWTVLYALMGIGAYIVYNSKSPRKKNALVIFFIQLLFNFFWSVIFFELKDFMFAFVWIVFLWLFILFTLIEFFKINKTAAYLLIPYLIWVTFAGYLNLALYILN